MVEFDPHRALTGRFEDANLARCVRETARMALENIDVLKCFQCDIQSVRGIEQLKNLKVLDLHFNYVSDGTPLGELKYLEDLHLGLNQCDRIEFLRSMTSLRNLTLFDNDIVDCGPVSALNKLKVLHLRINDISDVSPLRGLTTLEELSLSSNLIEDISPLSALTNLRVLNFYRNDIRDISAVSGMKKLRELFLGQNPIADFTPLFELPNLVDVRVVGTPAPDTHKDHLAAHLQRNRDRLGVTAPGHANRR